MDKQKKLNKAKALASQFFDLKLIDLERMTEDQKSEWMQQYSGLTREEFEDVRRQVIEAKTSQQAQVGWQSLPHDLSVLVFCLVTVFFSLKAGLVAGVIVLALLVSITQVYFNEALYKILGYANWLTYPAYILLAFALYQRGLIWWQIAGIVALAWGGTFLLGAIMSIPMTLYLQARAKSNQIKSEQKNKAGGK
jgi:hypothetical protein